MKTATVVARLERQIDTIKQQIQALGPIHPGSVSRQYHVCGNPACRCLHPRHPRRHGPYYKLAYVHRGKPVCRFVRADCVQRVKMRLAAYKTFRSLMDQWIELSLRRGVIEFFSPVHKKTARKPA